MTRRPLSFALLLPLLLSAQPVATDSYLPALPAIAQALGSASTSLTVFALAFGIGQLPMGSLADRFGRRQVLLIGLACYPLTRSRTAPTWNPAQARRDRHRHRYHDRHQHGTHG